MIILIRRCLLILNLQCLSFDHILFSDRYVLESDHMKKFFDYIQLPNFDIASDAFATFKVGQAVAFCFPRIFCFQPPIAYEQEVASWARLNTVNLAHFQGNDTRRYKFFNVISIRFVDNSFMALFIILGSDRTLSSAFFEENKPLIKPCNLRH